VKRRYAVSPGWRAALAALCLATGPVLAQESLPQPLDLETALGQAETPHYDVMLREAQVDAARADLEAVEANYAWDVWAEGQVRFVDPNKVAINGDSDQNDDHKASLMASKRLYDFGRRDALENAAEAGLESARMAYTDGLKQRRLEIMQRYFDVLLADLEYMVQNERMAIVFIRMDEMEDENELGRVSDVELLAQQAEYQEVLSARAAAANRQRTARAALAEALNRPEEVPADVLPPRLGSLFDRERGDYAELVEQALETNPLINSLAQRLEAADERVRAARKSDSPYLDGELEAAAYTRDLSGRDDLRAGVRLTVPLYKGGRTDAEVARALAEKKRVRALLAKTRRDVRHRLLEVWQRIDDLNTRREEDWARMDFRELYLDRARSLYDLEVATDLGDAMVEHTRARLKKARTEYSLALAWAELNALLGREITAFGSEE